MTGAGLRSARGTSAVATSAAAAAAVWVAATRFLRRRESDRRAQRRWTRDRTEGRECLVVLVLVGGGFVVALARAEAAWMKSVRRMIARDWGSGALLEEFGWADSRPWNCGGGAARMVFGVGDGMRGWLSSLDWDRF